jgi:hypothetical protein
LQKLSRTDDGGVGVDADVDATADAVSRRVPFSKD